MERKIYTVGHSNHDIEYFVQLLTSNHINCLIDVRSIPASSYNPQFNKEPLKNFLKKRSIIYMHFGAEFGARHEDPDLLDNEGIVNFKKFQKTRQFQDGVERVDIGISKGYKIALMCSEGNPLECHRFSMISNVFVNEGIEVVHILKDNKLKTHKELEKNLEKKYEKRLPKKNLFEPGLNDSEKLELIYDFHNKEIGWKSNKIEQYN